MTPDPPIDDALLVAHATGELQGEDAERVARHVAENADARRLVELVRMVGGAVRPDGMPDPEPALMERLRAIFVEGASPGRAPSRASLGQPSHSPLAEWWRAARIAIAELLTDIAPQPVIAGVRGDGETGVHLCFRAADSVIDLQVGTVEAQPEDRGSPLARVIGQVTTMREDERPSCVEIAALPVGSETPHTTNRSDDGGLFVLHLPAGEYELRIARLDASSAAGPAPGATVVSVGPVRVGRA